MKTVPFHKVKLYTVAGRLLYNTSSYKALSRWYEWQKRSSTKPDFFLKLDTPYLWQVLEQVSQQGVKHIGTQKQRFFFSQKNLNVTFKMIFSLKMTGPESWFESLVSVCAPMSLTPCIEINLYFFHKTYIKVYFILQ